MSENDKIKLSDELNEDALFVESDKASKDQETDFIQQTIFDLGFFDETSGFVETKRREVSQIEEKEHVEPLTELFDGFDFSEEEKQIIMSDALLRQSELSQDGEYITLEKMLIDVIAEYQAKKDAYEKTLLDIVEEHENQQELENKTLPHPELPAEHYLNVDTSELSKNMAEDREDNEDLYRR